MNVSKREEALAKELYEIDMSLGEGAYLPWEDQISYARAHYLKLASKIVNSRWFSAQIELAREASRDRLEG